MMLQLQLQFRVGFLTGATDVKGVLRVAQKVNIDQNIDFNYVSDLYSPFIVAGPTTSWEVKPTISIWFVTDSK
jgi:hypothetical protein